MKWLWLSFLLITFLITRITFGQSDTQNTFLIKPKDNNTSERFIKFL